MDCATAVDSACLLSRSGGCEWGLPVAARKAVTIWRCRKVAVRQTRTAHLTDAGCRVQAHAQAHVQAQQQAEEQAQGLAAQAKAHAAAQAQAEQAASRLKRSFSVAQLSGAFLFQPAPWVPRVQGWVA